MAGSAEHECVGGADVDCDVCPECGEHTGFCEVCGLSECCAVRPHFLE